MLYVQGSFYSIYDTSFGCVAIAVCINITSLNQCEMDMPGEMYQVLLCVHCCTNKPSLSSLIGVSSNGWGLVACQSCSKLQCLICIQYNGGG